MSHHEDPEERRARFQRARKEGGICGACGRALAEGELVWWVSFRIGGRYAGAGRSWLVPVGAECVPADVKQATAGQEPERCAGCGRDVHHLPSKRPRTRARCSRRCQEVDANRRQRARKGRV